MQCRNSSILIPAQTGPYATPPNPAHGLVFLEMTAVPKSVSQCVRGRVDGLEACTLLLVFQFYWSWNKNSLKLAIKPISHKRRSRADLQKRCLLEEKTLMMVSEIQESTSLNNVYSLKTALFRQIIKLDKTIYCLEWWQENKRFILYRTRHLQIRFVSAITR